jgi:hypothetical protein
MRKTTKAPLSIAAPLAEERNKDSLTMKQHRANSTVSDSTVNPKSSEGPSDLLCTLVNSPASIMLIYSQYFFENILLN